MVYFAIGLAVYLSIGIVLVDAIRERRRLTPCAHVLAVYVWPIVAVPDMIQTASERYWNQKNYSLSSSWFWKDD